MSLKQKRGKNEKNDTEFVTPRSQKYTETILQLQEATYYIGFLRKQHKGCLPPPLGSQIFGSQQCLGSLFWTPVQSLQRLRTRTEWTLPACTLSSG